MTQTNPHATVCPSCRSSSSVGLSDGILLCLDCRNEWNPTQVRPLAVVPPIPQAATETVPASAVAAHPVPPAQVTVDPADDVLGPPETVLAAQAADAALEALKGTQVILEGGQVATVVDFPDDDHVEVLVGQGGANLRTEVVPFDVVERSLDAPPPVLDVDDETAGALASVNFTVAGLVLRAGLASIAGEYPDAELLTPPTGWLPLDAEGLPALEQGVAYAIAFLIHAYSIDRTQIAAMADTLLEVAQTQTTLKGGEQE